MLIWRGWGILTVGFGIVGIVLGTLLGVVLGGAGMGIGVILAGAATTAFGHWINVVRPVPQVAALLAARERELTALVEAGAYRPSSIGLATKGAYRPPTQLPMPRSLDEARRMAADQLAAESAHVRGELVNAHTLFFVPMQYAGWAMLALGAGLLGYGLAVGS